MRLDVNAGDGSCTVKYVSTHVGHACELGKLQLTKSERNRVAADIACGIPYSVILENIRDSVTDSKLERFHLITRQDLQNIERRYNLSYKSTRHQNDAVSVDAWVREVNNGDSPCVLFYKPQDMVIDSYPQLKNTDFVLIIMNGAQRELLKKYGSDCICVDGTHGLNGYNFELISLLVLDDMRQGFPCAFLISNRNDCQVMSIFYQHIKEEVGEISPKVFMSDLAESFYNAWLNVMEPPAMRLYCAWHVDRCWRKNLGTKIQGKEVRENVYKQVRTLMFELDPIKFEQMLPVAVDQLKCDPDTSAFGLYFEQNYVDKAKFWAYCYRLNAGVNTNMHVERMHGSLKYLHLHAKFVKRLDKAIFAIMSFVKDKLFDRLIVLHKGKVSHKTRDIRQRHKSAVKVSKDHITKDGSVWKVQSSSNDEVVYIVAYNDVRCKCGLICTECKVCIHRYTCTCLDHSIKSNMCKHIHMVCQNQSEGSHKLLKLTTFFLVKKVAFLLMNKQKYYKKFKKKSVSESSVPLQDQKRYVISEFSDVVNDMSLKELEIAKKLLISLKATLAASRVQKKDIETTNPKQDCQKRKIVPQRRFYSTKKPRKSAAVPLEVPNFEETRLIKMSLLRPKDESTPEADRACVRVLRSLESTSVLQQQMKNDSASLSQIASEREIGTFQKSHTQHQREQNVPLPLVIESTEVGAGLSSKSTVTLVKNNTVGSPPKVNTPARMFPLAKAGPFLESGTRQQIKGIVTGTVKEADKMAVGSSPKSVAKQPSKGIGSTVQGSIPPKVITMSGINHSQNPFANQPGKGIVSKPVVSGPVRIFTLKGVDSSSKLCGKQQSVEISSALRGGTPLRVITMDGVGHSQSSSTNQRGKRIGSVPTVTDPVRIFTLKGVDSFGKSVGQHQSGKIGSASLVQTSKITDMRVHSYDNSDVHQNSGRIGSGHSENALQVLFTDESVDPFAKAIIQ